MAKVSMRFLFLLLLLLLMAVSTEASIRVINKSPPDGKIVKAGRGVRLSCRTDRYGAGGKKKTLVRRRTI